MGIVSRILQRSSSKRQSRVYVDYSSDEELPTSPSTSSRILDLVCSQVSIKSNIQDLLSSANQLDVDSKLVKQYLDDMVKLMDSCSVLSDILTGLQLYAKAAQRALNISSKTGKWNRANRFRLKNALDRLPASPSLIIMSSSPSKKSSSTFGLIRTASMDKKLRQLIQQQFPVDIVSLELSIKKIASAVEAGEAEMDADVIIDAAAASAQLLEASAQELQIHVDAFFRNLRDASVALN